MTSDITQTPEFQRWFAGSQVVDSNGLPLKLYRGLNGPQIGDIDRMEGRPSYAMFFSNNPAVAGTYANQEPEDSIFVKHATPGAIFPVYVRATLKEFPIRVDRDGYRRFDMFEFDRQAKMLGAGQGIVARQIHDLGPRTQYEADPENHRDRPSDTYSFGRGTSIKSAVGAQRFNPNDPRMTEQVNNPRGFYMTKTFHEILAEQDDEYTYTVRSTADVHDPERFDRIRLSFLPYQVKSIEAGAYATLAKDNKYFPNEPNSPTFSVKVVTGLPVPKDALIQTLAMTLHVHHSHLLIDGEDDIETDLVNEPESISNDFSQSLVGTRRIGEFVQELRADRKEREKKTITREVYESYFTTHRGLETLVKKPIRNGYYMIEQYREDGKSYLRAEGPFDTRPDGNAYHDRIRATNAKVISENTSAGLYGVQMLVDALIEPDTGERMFEVGVHDLDTGRRFTSMVRAMSPEIARSMAVRQVAEANRLDPSMLSAMAPKEKTPQR